MTSLLKRGFTTSSAGGFFFIPYLQQLLAHDLVTSLGQTKEKGVPNEKLALGIVFESLFGYTAGIRAVDSVSRIDFGILCGLPFLPSPSTQYRFLQDVTMKQALDFQVKLGKRLLKLKQIAPCSTINIDGHNLKTYSRKAMKHSFITKEGRYGKAIRTFYTQDQNSRKPLVALATYSGTTVSQVTSQLAICTKDILGQDFIMVADKEWYCGELINELHKRHGIKVLVPIRESPKRRKVFEAVSLQKYQKTILGNIAALYTTMENFDGPLLMLLKKKSDDKYFALITPDIKMTSQQAMPTYTKRWRIENFFKDNEFMGINRLPSLNLNAIQTMLSLRLLAFNAMDNFRNDLGDRYCRKTPQLIHRQFIDGVQGRVQMRGNDIIVSLYGFEHQNAVASIMKNLQSKLTKANVDPRIPWLGNRCLMFDFH